MHDSVVDDNGNAWITDSVANNFRTLAKVDPRTGQVTGYKLVAPDGRRAGSSHGITKDQNGILWFNTSGSLARLDPATETFELYTPPQPPQRRGEPPGGRARQDLGWESSWRPPIRSGHERVQIFPE